MFGCTSPLRNAKNLKKERNVVVMLPASLRSNFIYKGLLFCGDPSYKNDILNNDKLIMDYDLKNESVINIGINIKSGFL